MSSMIESTIYQRWLRKPYWHLNEAVSLLLGVDPEQLSSACQENEVFDEYRDLINTAIRSEGRNLSVISRTRARLHESDYAKVLPAEFVKWAQHLGYLIPSELLVLLESCKQEDSESEATPTPTNSANQSELGENTTDSGLEGKLKSKKIEERLQRIQTVISDLGYKALEVPTGGKQKIKAMCLSHSNLFTESTFDKAWQKARQSSLVKMLEHKKFL